ncbi:MAG: PAS domain-containing sensor histidine kinase, partial [Gallionella sp.]|nr:PAS domain-containing sensor histidine kinase [Gallionella sp.]
ASDAFFRMLGYTEEEMLGMNVTQWDEQWASDILKAQIGSSGRNSIAFESRLRRRDGSIIEAEINASLVEIDGQQLICSSARDITGRKATERQLHDLTAYLQSVREEEKVAIAREIHDDLGGMLTAMKIESYWLKSELKAHHLEATALFERALEMAHLIDNASAAMRNVITGLRPSILDDLGLLAALEWQAARFQKLAGIESRVNCIGDKGDLDRARSIALFRVAQEALSNVAKHSGASRLEIEYHHSDEEVVMSVIDNGRGIMEKPESAEKHYGILGMRERVEQLGGKISIDTPPGGGFNLTVIMPLPVGKKRRKNDTHPDSR